MLIFFLKTSGSKTVEHPCRRFLVHDSFDPATLLSPFDAALIELDGFFDIRDPRNAMLSPCRVPDYEATAVLFGLASLSGPILVPTSLLTRVTLENYHPSICGEILHEFGASFDLDGHICYGSMVSFTAFFIFSCFSNGLFSVPTTIKLSETEFP